MNKYNAYKYIWNKLKEHIEDEHVLNLMHEYELEIQSNRKLSKKKKCSQAYPIKISKQPWYHTYEMIAQLIHGRKTRGTIKMDLVESFKKDFKEWTKQVATNEKTTEELGEWLVSKHKEFQSRESGKLQGVRELKKAKFTESGFERKHSYELSLEERAAIVIDELISMFIPKIPVGYNVNVEYYKEDWKQELWVWCWEHKDTDSNLNSLIIKYNRLSTYEYSFHKTNILSRMNSYIVPYILKLQHSCNEIARYRVNNKFMKEQLYPADNIHVFLKEYNIDPETITLLNMNKEVVKWLFENLKNYISIKDKSFQRYKKILEMRYGLNPENKIYTYKEIGTYFGISKQRVRQSEDWMLQQFREIIKNKKLEI